MRKAVSILILIVLLTTLPVFSATYGNKYQPTNSASYTIIVGSSAMLPSQNTLNKMVGMASPIQQPVLLGVAEDPFDPGAGTDNPNAYNDVTVGEGLFISFLLAFCYGAFRWFSGRKIRNKQAESLA
ncbi:MAG: hypothetical protein P4L28_07565 [Paludibacteraceae bacterium]|nr:hypothetical protein [Paludibacteraceae bacterium]